jgi:glycosyltransferase involved in cell wall biosynthesis
MKILCIVDSYNWALSNRADGLKKNLDKHSFLIKHFRDIKMANFNNFDIVYVMNWPIHGYVSNKISRKRKYRLVTSVSSHIGRKHASKMKSLFSLYDGISTSSKFLFSEFKPVYSNTFYTPFGVESGFFIPKTNVSRLSNVFGWAGNKTRKVKKFSIIDDVFKELGGDYKLKVAYGNLNREQMIEFYNSIGTLICFSESEGTPNPVLEAASCGRAIISSNVGNVPELNKNGNIYIVNSREELKRNIEFCKENPSILEEKGRGLRKDIRRDWCWTKRSSNFKKFLGI